MGPLFTLANTYELMCELGNTVRPIRIEVFHSLENPNLFRARVWEQTTYNLYPTWANIFEGEGLQNRMLSCDELNREITMLIAEEPDIITGKECDCEATFMSYLQEYIGRYLESMKSNAEPSA